METMFNSVVYFGFSALFAILTYIVYKLNESHYIFFSAGAIYSLMFACLFVMSIVGKIS